MSYLSGTVCNEVPFWEMATTPIDVLRARANSIHQQLSSSHSSRVRVIETEALPGAGSAPGSSIPSIALAISSDHSDSLRSHAVPVIARVDGSETIIDLRSCAPSDDEVLVQALSALSL